MGWLDALNPTATGALEWLPMLYKDPGLLVSIIETSKALAEQQTIRIDESIIEKAVLEECVPLSGLSITELACCGLRSNRLLLYGTLKERGLSHEFIAFISPAKSPVVWTDKAWTVTFEVDGPRMQAANLRTDPWLISCVGRFCRGLPTRSSRKRLSEPSKRRPNAGGLVRWPAAPPTCARVAGPRSS